MSLTTETVLILVGALFLLIGLLGGGIEISAIKVPTAGTPQRAILGLIGIVMIAVGGKYVMDQSSQGEVAAAAPPAASAPAEGDPAASSSVAQVSSPTEPAASAPTGDPPASDGEK